MTLVIFFPRSIEGEISARESRHQLSSVAGTPMALDTESVISRFEPPDLTIPEDASWTIDKSPYDEMPALSPNRKRGSDVEFGRISRMSVNPMVHNFTSPIGELLSLRVGYGVD